MKTDSKKSKWGIGVFVLYGGFVLFILSLVLFVSIQDIQFTESNYYEKGLAYQEHIDKVKRTNALQEKIEIEYLVAENRIKLSYPDSLLSRDLSGKIKLFRPSNSRLDFWVDLQFINKGEQLLETSKMASGIWKIQVDWTIDRLDYFIEETVYIN